jgi:RNA polymerase sigma factor (sigma-70 family)
MPLGPPPDADDAQLLRAFIDSRDDLAFGRIVARHAAGVRRTALLETGNAEAAEDVTQATFIVLSRRPRPALRSAKRKSSAEPWLHQVARYAAANWRRAEHRRRKREKAVAMPDRTAAQDPSQSTDLAEAVAAALRTLRRRDRRLILLRHVEEKPWSEVAARVGMSPEAARKATDRAMERLKGELERRGISAKGAIVGAALASLAHAATTRVSLATSALNTRVLEIAKETLIMLRLETGFKVGSAIAVIAMAVTLATQAIGLGGNAGGTEIGQPGATMPSLQAAPAGAMPAPKQPDAQDARTKARDQAADLPGGLGDVLRLELADGVSLEVLAITDGDTWWTPSGNELQEAKLEVRIPSGPGMMMLRSKTAVVLRFTEDAPSDASISILAGGIPHRVAAPDVNWFGPAPQARWRAGSEDWRPIPNAHVVVLSPDAQVLTQDLQIGFDPFRTVVSFDAHDPAVLLDSEGRPVALGHLGDTFSGSTGERTAAVTNIIDTAPGTEPQVALIGNDGIAVFGTNTILHLPNGSRLISTVFPTLSASQARNVELRRQPVVNIRLTVAGQPDAQVEASAVMLPQDATTRAAPE